MSARYAVLAASALGSLQWQLTSTVVLNFTLLWVPIAVVVGSVGESVSHKASIAVATLLTLVLLRLPAILARVLTIEGACAVVVQRCSALVQWCSSAVGRWSVDRAPRLGLGPHHTHARRRPSVPQAQRLSHACNIDFASHALACPLHPAPLAAGPGSSYAPIPHAVRVLASPVHRLNIVIQLAACLALVTFAAMVLPGALPSSVVVAAGVRCGCAGP